MSSFETFVDYRIKQFFVFAEHLMYFSTQWYNYSYCVNLSDIFISFYFERFSISSVTKRTLFKDIDINYWTVFCCEIIKYMTLIASVVLSVSFLLNCDYIRHFDKHCFKMGHHMEDSNRVFVKIEPAALMWFTISSILE